MIVSTGLHNIRQVKKTYNFLKKKKIKFALLHTTNVYPTSDSLLRLNSIIQLKNIFPKTIIGLSDHTGDLLSSIIALSLGANIIEKHFVNKKNLKGPDITSSIDEYQLKKLIIDSKRVKHQLDGNKNNLIKQEDVTRKFAFASVVSTRKILKGEKFSEKNLWVMRPGTGDYKSDELKKIFGKIAKRNIRKKVQIKKNDF